MPLPQKLPDRRRQQKKPTIDPAQNPTIRTNTRPKNPSVKAKPSTPHDKKLEKIVGDLEEILKPGAVFRVIPAETKMTCGQLKQRAETVEDDLYISSDEEGEILE